MKKWIVTETWEVVYHNPIILQKGEYVTIDFTKREENPDWQGWLWVISHNNAGWVPMQVLDVTGDASEKTAAVVNAFYSAQELPAQRGDFVEGDGIVNGWLWCRKPGTETFGWLPLQQLIAADV